VSAKFVQPCIPTSAKAIPTGDAWTHEPKFDGYRFQIVKNGREVSLFSRRGAEWTKRLPGFAAPFLALPCRTAVLDGELVLPDENGVPDFGGLRRRATDERELIFFAFDLLFRDSHDLRLLPLTERRRRLVRLVTRAEIPCLHLVATFEDGAKLLLAAERHGLEGIVSKRRDVPYRSGPSRDWVKTKTAAWRASNRERWRLFARG
jgi:bifunctional non-homologous end joining protein LigD